MKELPILFSTPMVVAIQEGKKNQTRRTQGLEKVNENPDEWEFNKIREYPSLREPRLWMTHNFEPDGVFEFKPRYQKGDHIWVRETFYAYGYWRYMGIKTKTGKEKTEFVNKSAVFENNPYRFHDNHPEHIQEGKLTSEPGVFKVGWFKRVSLFMPRAASRITLECTGVRCERLHDISEKDAKDEGTKEWNPAHDVKYLEGSTSMMPKPCGPHKFSFMLLWCKINGVVSWDKNPWVFVYDFKRIEK